MIAQQKGKKLQNNSYRQCRVLKIQENTFMYKHQMEYQIEHVLNWHMDGLQGVWLGGCSILIANMPEILQCCTMP